MLDVRALAYVSPLAEQPQTSITPSVRVQNFADEDAIVAATFRIYRDSTGLLEYTSQSTPLELEHGTTAEIPALTPFDPTTIADDDYFIICDLVATSSTSGTVLPFALGKYYFDVKATPTGPAPAGHHATHELGGSDELDCTGLPGTGGAGVSDHGALTGLEDDDHPQYHLEHEFWETCDFESPLGNYGFAPWYGQAIGAGTGSPTTGSALHIGVFRISAAAAAGTGYRVYFYNGAWVIAGKERSNAWYRSLVLASTMHFGFHDATTGADPTDGVWIWQDPATGIVYGRTMDNTVGSQTATGFQLVVNVWYLLRIVVNDDATRVDFYVYDEAGTELWTDNLTTNIPTAGARVLGHGIVAVSSAGAAAIADVDFFDIKMIDRRPEPDYP